MVINRMQGAGAVEAPYTGFLLFTYTRAVWSVEITMVTRRAQSPTSPPSSGHNTSPSLSEQPGWEMPLSLFQTLEQEPGWGSDLPRAVQPHAPIRMDGPACRGSHPASV